MVRGLRPLGPAELGELPCACSGCVFWETAHRLQPRCGAECDLEKFRDWYERVSSEWGECGRMIVEDDEVLGFIKYAPAVYLPQAGFFPTGAPDDAAVLIACLHIRDDVRSRGLGQVLLHAALRDLMVRGEKTVYCIAAEERGDVTYRPVVGVEFLLRNGFTVHRAHPQYPMLKLDLRTLARVTEPLEAMVQALRLPLRAPKGAPSPSIHPRG